MVWWKRSKASPLPIAVDAMSVTSDSISHLFSATVATVASMNSKIGASAIHQSWLYRSSKRLFDIAASAGGLMVVSPLLLLAAIAVKLDSRGPVFFRQERIGRRLRPFRIYKFRTMVVDAPKLGGQITAGVDPRITRVGHVLRKTKLDELAQLINVLLGDMSLVGPRPEVPKYVEMFRDEFAALLVVRPGITDPASIKYRDESSLLAQADDAERMYVEQILPDKLQISTDYAAQATLFSDLRVILKTVLGGT
jgi:lipopolysaccharide/colanic/teichoic acid biosynthesis glycosyltransferase